MSNIYSFSVNSLQGEEINFADFEGQVILVVNTASKCGFTPQYEGLQKLHEDYSEKGLVIVGCPCNQFGGQEPGDASAISAGCLINYGVDFSVTEKVEVNGDNAHPLFNYLKQALPGMLGNKIKWNFTKFLIGKDGIPIKRFAPQAKPLEVEPYIQAALQ
ncbi:glutathione peroxidase [Teredinibacter franksiae]|uniref:glutathione peroxidase n=1 Tax=Teredinibacter franksiae TaxID=2761453 RepID=UPI001623F7E9|nr:glutathione peroxidase [Teredinibacter franksiae]